MDLPPDTVLVFDRTDDLLVFESFVHAANWLEAIDIDEGEYPAAYTPDGGVVALTTPEAWRGPVVLTRTDRADREDLARRVARYWSLHQEGRSACDPVQTASFLIDRDNQLWKGRLRRLLGG
ncbi:hypothetical protein [Streptomyces aurantiogriseus]|uniref:Uncharacterized protein n=1 Tax=Streptomyces aurantiogriseus TaxID=66870 RepID=A0A918CJ55_9ACTN|nr:hypothetical protein [Streptomyces aurantiogriseus]GGR26820.1 hypothetical protein GCM10010251_48750 [Streptomyces aurantiogriseus]